MSGAAGQVALVLFCLLAICLSAVVMLFTFATLTGWRRLARTYASRGAHPTAYRSASVFLSDHAWSAPPLRVRVGDEALVLEPRIPFRPFFPVVEIPWREIVSISVRKRVLSEMHELLLAHGGPKRGGSSLGLLPSPAVAAIERRLVSPVNAISV